MVIFETFLINSHIKHSLSTKKLLLHCHQFDSARDNQGLLEGSLYVREVCVSCEAAPGPR